MTTFTDPGRTPGIEPLRDLCDRLTALHDAFDSRLDDELADRQAMLEDLLWRLLRLVGDYRDEVMA